MKEMSEHWKWTDNELSTVPQYFYKTCESFPERTAQRFNADIHNGDNGGSFTWKELKERVESLSCGLMGLGTAKQDKIAIMSPSSHYWTQADMAIANAGAVSVTIYPTLSINEVTYIMNDSESRFMFAGNAEIMEAVLSVFDEIPALEKIIVMDITFESSDNRVIGISDLMKDGRDWGKENFETYENRWKSVSLDDWYTILYTSGTTGQGKGAILTHWSASTRMEGASEYFDRYGMSISEEDVTLCFLPLSHIFDRGSCQLLAICWGSCICYADNPGTLLSDMQKYNPTWLNCVPRLYEKIYITFQQQMAASPLKKKIFDWALSVGEKAVEYRRDENGLYDMTPTLDLKSRLPFFLKMKYTIADRLFSKVRALFGNRFRHSFSASAAIAPDLLRFFYIIGFAVIEGYGSTESCNACILNPLTACKPGFMGRNANGSNIRIADDGELEISGAGLFRGYLNKDAETAESFTGDGWFRTGDIVELSDDGYVRFIERKKGIICTAVGKNVAPAKLENLFSTSSVIEQIFLVGDERNYITALIVPGFNYFVELYEKQNIPYDSDALTWSETGGVRICTAVGPDFTEKQVLKDLIAEDVEKANKQLESFEKIRNYAVITSRFTEENGQLTPTQKAKKRVILRDYADTIESLYSGN